MWVMGCHPTGLVGVVKNSSMDLIETQLKLAAQKWKAKCRMTKHDQSWQDEDVSGRGGDWERGGDV